MHWPQLSTRDMFSCCRKTNPKNAEEAKAKWTEGRKYTLNLVQPNGSQLEIIAGYMEQVCLRHFRGLNSPATCVPSPGTCIAAKTQVNQR